jgi:protein ImuB
MRAPATSRGVPLVTAARREGLDVITCANDAARGRGVRRGQTLAMAGAVCADLHIRRDDPAADRSLLENLAAALLRFTPDVALDGTCGLLLEIGRTAFHFGGEDGLARHVRDLLAGWGFRAALGVADTPMAARTLARAPGDGIRHAPADARQILAEVPIRSFPLPVRTRRACRIMGVKTVGGLLVLPPAGVAARFGPELVRDLEHLTGVREELLELFRPPEIFRSVIEWTPATGDIGSLCFAAKRVLDLAEAHLAAGERGALRVDMDFRLESTHVLHRLTLRPSRPTRHARVLLEVLQHQLEKDGLPAPAERIELALAEAVALEPAQLQLFSTAEPVLWTDEGARLCDRLKGRLGAPRVLGARLSAEVRPELGFEWFAAGEPPPKKPLPAPPGRRPLVLEDAPIPIAIEADEAHRKLHLRGRGGGEELRIVRGAERIESGWWDGFDVRRRYFEVESARGARAWLFEDLQDGRWYRHGDFA